MTSPAGWRRLARMGNADRNTEWRLKLLRGTYYWSVQAIDAAFAGSPFAPEQIVSVTTAVPDEALSERVVIRASPNPFTSSTAIDFTLAAATSVRITIRDLSGRSVRVLGEREWPAGPHRIAWDGAMDNGAPAPSGIYFASLFTPNGGDRLRIVRLR